MKVIELTTYPGELRVDPDQIPQAVVNAVEAQRKAYPDVLNHSQSKDFDRLFEQRHKCRIEYTRPNRIVWPNPRDYTLFLLEWT